MKDRDKDTPITLKDLDYFRDVREWLGITNRRAIRSYLSGKLIGYVKLSNRVNLYKELSQKEEPNG